MADFVADQERQAQKLVSGNRFEGAFGQFLFDLELAGSETGQFLLVRCEDFFVEGFEFDRTEGINSGLMVAVPVHESAFGDAELIGNAIEAEALGAEFDELVYGGEGMHGSYGQLQDYMEAT